MSVENINRLGFTAWADSLIVDFIESHKETLVNQGSITTERADGTTLRATHGEGRADILVRGYTGHGWETHERSVKLDATKA